MRRMAIFHMRDAAGRRGARPRGYRHRAIKAREFGKEWGCQDIRGSAMALVQYPQFTGDGLGIAPRPPLLFEA
jgi:hypothetical protein